MLTTFENQDSIVKHVFDTKVKATGNCFTLVDSLNDQILCNINHQALNIHLTH